MTATAPSPNFSSVALEHEPLALVDERRESYVECAAETAECTCPDACERDHEND